MSTKITIIGNTLTSKSNEVLLIKMLSVLQTLSDQIYVISDWSPKFPFGKKVKVVNNIKFVNLHFNHSSLIQRAIKLLLIEITICFNLITATRHTNVIFFFNSHQILPITLAKLMGKKIVFHAASRTYTSDITNGRISQPIIGSIINNVNRVIFGLTDIIMIESLPHLSKWLKMDRYSNKNLLGSLFVDTDLFFLQTDFRCRESLVGYVGMLYESKGIMQFVEAIPKVLSNNPSVKFLIIGSGPCESKIKQTIKKLKLENSVILEDWLPNSEIPIRLNKLKLLVLPSVSEGLPNIALEAMACGTPVIATKVGGIPDIISNEVTGFLLNDNSSNSIANSIISALTNCNLNKISKNSENLILDNYCFKAAIDRYNHIFLNLYT